VLIFFGMGVASRGNVVEVTVVVPLVWAEGIDDVLLNMMG
jgi:hypothetical protein